MNDHNISFHWTYHSLLLIQRVEMLKEFRDAQNQRFTVRL